MSSICSNVAVYERSHISNMAEASCKACRARSCVHGCMSTAVCTAVCTAVAEGTVRAVVRPCYSGTPALEAGTILLNLAKFSSTKFSVVLSLAKFSLLLLLLKYGRTGGTSTRSTDDRRWRWLPLWLPGLKTKRVKPPLGDFQAI